MNAPAIQQQPALILGPPAEIDAATLAFCATIAPAEPFYVPVRPVAWGKHAYCFENSVTQGARKGGGAAYGWAIWHWPGRYFEAEHHAVWRTPEGKLIDVTPQTGAPERILFLPDPAAVFDPAKYRRNVMAPDAGNALAAEYIALAGRRRDITDLYWEPGMDVLPLFSPADRERLAPLEARMDELVAAMREPSDGQAA
jgi:hypothetical protein